MARLLVKFVRDYPQVHVNIVTEGRLMDLVTESFDLGARVSALITSDMDCLVAALPAKFRLGARFLLFRYDGALKASCRSCSSKLRTAPHRKISSKQGRYFERNIACAL